VASVIVQKLEAEIQHVWREKKDKSRGKLMKSK
jgi:hypothetical protein